MSLKVGNCWRHLYGICLLHISLIFCLWEQLFLNFWLVFPIFFACDFRTEKVLGAESWEGLDKILWFYDVFMNWFAGVTKLNILPRPWFAKAQKALFHRYFMGGLMLNSVMLATHISRNPISGWGKESLHRVS